MKKLTLSILFLTAVTGCGVSNSSNVSSIVNEDQRQIISKESLQNQFGILSYNDEFLCNAFWSGKQKITTAAHCFTNIKDLKNYKFISPSGKETSLTSSQVSYKADLVTFDTLEENQAPLLEIGIYNPNKEIQIIAYDPATKKNLLSSVEESERTSSNGLIIHTLDTTSGYSGAAMIQENKIVAMHISTMRDLNQNLAIELNEVENVDLSLFENSASLDNECYKYNPFCGNKKVTSIVRVCGVGISVSTGLLFLCKAAVASIPPTCSAAPVDPTLFAASSCGIATSTAAGACGVSVAALTKAAFACIDTIIK